MIMTAALVTEVDVLGEMRHRVSNRLQMDLQTWIQCLPIKDPFRYDLGYCCDSAHSTDPKDFTAGLRHNRASPWKWGLLCFLW